MSGEAWVCQWSGCPHPDHLDQSWRGVYKHQHMGDGSCSAPWSAICQTTHGDLCHVSEHETQPAALDAMCAHIAARVHIAPGSGDVPHATTCRPTTTEDQP